MFKCVVENFFLFLNKNICYGFSNEPSQGDGAFEQPRHIFKILG